MRAPFAVLLLAACSSGELPPATAGELETLAPVAVLFTVPGCRYCDIAERGFVGAARELPQVRFRKVVVGPGELAALQRRYGIGESMPQARLLLAGSWR